MSRFVYIFDDAVSELNEIKYLGGFMSGNSVVIVSAKRTPMGGFNGSLSSLKATQLGEVAISAACSELDVSHVDEVILGCVLPAGLGQSPARQASLGAGLPGINAVVMIMSTSRACSSNSFISAAINASLMTLA